MFRGSNRWEDKQQTMVLGTWGFTLLFYKTKKFGVQLDLSPSGFVLLHFLILLFSFIDISWVFCRSSLQLGEKKTNLFVKFHLLITGKLKMWVWHVSHLIFSIRGLKTMLLKISSLSQYFFKILWFKLTPVPCINLIETQCLSSVCFPGNSRVLLSSHFLDLVDVRLFSQ